MLNKNVQKNFLLFLIFFLLIICNLIFGSITIPLKDFFQLILSPESADRLTQNIIYKYRYPQMVTAMLTGAALSVSGLQIQTLFRNPLAGPSVLGISSGAGLGVAIIMILFGSSSIFISSFTFLRTLGVTLAAFIGSMSVLLIILLISKYVKGNSILLIIGLMIGYVTSAIIGLLQFIASQSDLKSFVMWGLGSFNKITVSQLPFFSSIICLFLILSLFTMKSMNTYMLGDKYAYNLGLNLKRMRIIIIVISGMLVSITTAYTGPIAFIGLAVPHLTRFVFHTSDHNKLLPYSMLLGAIIALLCNLIARLPGLDSSLPINTITSLFGAPLVIYYIVKQRN